MADATSPIISRRGLIAAAGAAALTALGTAACSWRMPGTATNAYAAAVTTSRAAATSSGSATGCRLASLADRLRTSSGTTPAHRVGALLQLPEFPSGCEPASLAIALRAWGYPVSIAELVDGGYFTYDASWSQADAYLGDPRGIGSALPPAVVRAATSYLTARNASLAPIELTGKPFKAIGEKAAAGIPVLTWSTVDATWPRFTLQRPSVDGYPWYTNFHCVVVYGIDGSDVLVSDPLAGLVRRDAARFSALHAACGSMAVALA